MKKFGNYEEAKKRASFDGVGRLPAGAYVVNIMGVRYEAGENGRSDQIVVQFDIAEGEYKDYFKKQYEANTSEDKKFKGRTSIWVPSDDGSERDGWTKNAFARWTDSFEKSNDGYSWDWDENKWKGKQIGIVFRNEGNVINGKEILYTAVAYPVSAKDVREGKIFTAKDKFRNGYTGRQQHEASANDFITVPEGTAEDIPF